LDRVKLSLSFTAAVCMCGESLDYFMTVNRLAMTQRDSSFQNEILLEFIRDINICSNLPCHKIINFYVHVDIS